MKKYVIPILAVCLVICVLFASMALNRQPSGNSDPVDWGTLYTYGDSTEQNTKIQVQTINGENHLILPSTLTPQAVALFFDIPDTVQVTGDLGSSKIKSGDPVDLTALCSEGNHTLTLTAKEGRTVSEYTVTLSFTDNISSMYLLSDDAENEGRLWVESSPDKSNKATGQMLLQKADGSIVYHDGLTQIKGRGNSTWGQAKKPYQIKLSEKTDLLETGSKDNRSKTWVLLANYVDQTSMRNTMMYDLGRALGMEFCPENSWVNLYYDGEYRGCYLLSEKVEIGSGRVDITDLEELNEEANADVDLENLPVETDKTANGATYWYCAGMNAPEDVTGGYLLEMEYDTRAEAEICRFVTSRGQHIVVKSPEYASKEEMDYIASLYQEWEDSIYHGGVNPTTGKKHTDYVDLRSAAICYLANELSKNQDGFQSSSYFYKDSGDDLMYMGPLWDYDSTLNFDGSAPSTGMYTARTRLGTTLCQLGDFRDMVRQIYLEELYPLLTDVVLGAADAVSANGTLHSIRHYDTLIAGSMASNDLVWENPKGWQSEVAQLTDFLSGRTVYLKNVFSGWSADTEFAISDFFFADVDRDAWYFEDVHQALAYGLIAGDGGDTYCPTVRTSRVEVIHTIYALAGRPTAEYREGFTDVNRNSWYANAVSWGLEQGVLPESSDGIFGPNEPIAREDVIVQLYRYAGSPESDGECLNAFADADAISDHARPAMAWAIEKNILVTQNGQLRPRDTTNRAELASMLVRTYEHLADN